MDKTRKETAIRNHKDGYRNNLLGTWSLIIALLYVIYPGDAKVSAWWIVLFYAILMLGEGFTCPIGYSITAVAAPKAFMTQMMTIWSMSQSTGAALNTLLTNFYKEGSEIPFFVAIGLGVCAIGAVVAIFSKKLAVGMGLDKNAEA